MSARRWSAAAGACLSMVLAAGPARAVSGSEFDSFEDGSTEGWISGSANPSPPINVVSGGPGGAGDHYLLATSSGAGQAGSKLVFFNTTQWAGDYLAAGITGITMDVKNFGLTDLELHLTLNSSATTVAGVAVPAGSGWTRVSFSLLPAALGGASSSLLSAVTELRLYHGNLGPATVAAQLGVDNIAAVVSAVPEPRAAALGLLGLTGVLASVGMHRRRQRSR